jgi:hypothetical protein
MLLPRGAGRAGPGDPWKILGGRFLLGSRRPVDGGPRHEEDGERE